MHMQTNASPFIAGRTSSCVFLKTCSFALTIGQSIAMVPMPLARRRAPWKVFAQSAPASSSILATSPLAALEMRTGVRLSTFLRSLARTFSRVVRGTITVETPSETETLNRQAGLSEPRGSVIISGRIGPCNQLRGRGNCTTTAQRTRREMPCCDIPQHSYLAFSSCSSCRRGSILFSQLLRAGGRILSSSLPTISRPAISLLRPLAGADANLDRLAAEGEVFDRAYLTTSSCSPTRCSIITGRYPHNTGAPELHMPLPAGQFMFPQALREAGYFTALAGKNHMGPAVDAAFDVITPGTGPGKERDWVQRLRERPQDKPFFMWFASFDAHRDWQTTEDTLYDPAKVVVPPFLVDGPLTRKDLADYYHEISRLDRFIGKVRAGVGTAGSCREHLHHLYGGQWAALPALQDTAVRQRDEDAVHRVAAGDNQAGAYRGDD